MAFHYKVLIIDDDEDDRSLFFDAVAELGRNVECLAAGDGEEALSLLLSSPDDLPALIFLDLNMPRMSGMQSLLAIRSLERLREIPVVIYSTTRRKDDVEATLRAGAVHFVTKPVLFADIVKMLSDMFDRHLEGARTLVYSAGE